MIENVGWTGAKSFRLCFLHLCAVVTLPAFVGGCGSLDDESLSSSTQNDKVNEASVPGSATGLFVKVKLGTPGQDDYVSRVNAEVTLQAGGKAVGTLELIRETTSGNERGDFFVRLDRNASGSFAGLVSAKQSGRVVVRQDQKYVQVRSGFSTDDVRSNLGINPTENAYGTFAAPFLGPKRTGLPPLQFGDYVQTDAGAFGVSEDKNIHITRHASAVGDDPSWSVLCSTPAPAAAAHAALRLCTIRHYRKNAPPGKPDSIFMGLVMCGEGPSRRYLTLSLSFASGDENQANRSKTLDPITLHVSGRHAVRREQLKGFKKAAAGASEPGTVFSETIEASPLSSTAPCDECGLPFAYTRDDILKDPVLSEVQKMYPGGDGENQRFSYLWRRNAKGLDARSLGQELVDWVLDGNDDALR